MIYDLTNWIDTSCQAINFFAANQTNFCELFMSIFNSNNIYMTKTYIFISKEQVNRN
jgi:hypothetical protein